MEASGNQWLCQLFLRPPHAGTAPTQGADIVVRTLGPLPAGSALLHCYGPQAGEMTRAQRQLALRRQYHFTCRCPACAHPPAEEGALAALRCPSAGCPGAVEPACDTPPGLLSRFPGVAGSGSCSR
jgi:hypothetical protein